MRRPHKLTRKRAIKLLLITHTQRITAEGRKAKQNEVLKPTKNAARRNRYSLGNSQTFSLKLEKQIVQ